MKLDDIVKDILSSMVSQEEYDNRRRTLLLKHVNAMLISYDQYLLRYKSKGYAHRNVMDMVLVYNFDREFCIQLRMQPGTAIFAESALHELNISEDEL